MSTPYDNAYDAALDEAYDLTLNELLDAVRALADRKPHLSPDEQARLDAYEHALDARIQV